MFMRKGSDGATDAGTLIIVGGHEDKTGDRLILRAIAARAGEGALVVVTAASNVPDELWGDYEPVFRDLGVRDVRHLHVDTREDALDPERLAVLDGAAVVFFTGGNQLKLTSQLGDTPVYTRVRALFEAGACVAGTSAGASVMTETMLVSGSGDQSHRIGGVLKMAPGIGLLPDVIVDQHFAERGRIGRLLAAVAQNPRILGIGIDEDTAILCEPGRCFTVLGAGAVYVADGSDITYTNLTEEERDRTLSVFGTRLHVLSMGDVFDVATRQPRNFSAEAVEEAIVGPPEEEEAEPAAQGAADGEARDARSAASGDRAGGARGTKRKTTRTR